MADNVQALGKLKVNELKQILKEKGLAVSGNKSELIARLMDHQDGTALEGDALEGVEDDSINTEEDESLLLDETGPTETPAKENGASAGVVADEEAEPPKKVLKTDASKETPRQQITMKPAEEETCSSTTEDPLAKRAERFGAVSADSKKLARAARFGVPIKGSGDDILKQRAERFGDQTSPTVTSTSAGGDEKLQKRAERFGISSTVNTGSTGDSSEKLKQRAERFGTNTSVSSPDEEKVKINVKPELLKKRAERFGAVIAPSLAKDEDKGKLEKRKERFGDAIVEEKEKHSDEEELKKKRADRFKTAA